MNVWCFSVDRLIDEMTHHCSSRGKSLLRTISAQEAAFLYSPLSLVDFQLLIGQRAFLESRPPLI